MITAICGGRIIDPASTRDEVADLYFYERNILAHDDVDPQNIGRKIDASGLIVCPGLIDLKSKMGEPGSEQHSTMRTESKAAIAGGVTTACIQPDSVPVLDSTAMAHMIRKNASEHSGIRIVPLGALTRGLNGKTLTNMAALKTAGCAGVTNARSAISNTLLMRRAMQYAATVDTTVFIQSHDPWLTGNGCVHEGELSTRLGLPAIPEAAETVAIARDLALVETTGVRAHFNQLSCARSVDMVSEMQSRGLEITADVTIHHLLLTEFDVYGFNTLCHVQPPLRSQRDRAGLRQGLKDGTISAICSDHAPCGIDDKLTPFSQSAPGISGLETLLPLTLRLVDEKVLSLQQAIACLTCNPAKILQLRRGNLAAGAPADICIFDPKATFTFHPEDMLSSGKNSPFGGWKLRGKVVHTIVDGGLQSNSL